MGRGSITYSQFAMHANDPEVPAFAEALDIELLNLKEFFSLLSERDKRPVNLEIFVIGCIKLKGLAKSMDLMDLIYSQKQAYEQHSEQLDTFESFCRDEFAEIKGTLSLKSPT